ncbi:MAG: hypothetical protein QOJ07_3610, partial [Thermoleophilaceae bacterium]|nr:hypothetical protein [Thermoleophilaceae bacterium]
MRRALGKVPDWLIGTVAVLIVVIATFLAFGGGVPWSSDYELKAQVASGLELQSRSPV